MSLKTNDSKFLITNEMEAQEAGKDAKLIENLSKKADIKIVQFVKRRNVQGLSQIDRKIVDLRRKTFPLENSCRCDKSDGVYDSPEVAKLLEENGSNICQGMGTLREHREDRRDVKSLTELKNYCDKEEEKEVAKLLEENERNISEETCKFEQNENNYCDKEEEKKQIEIFDLQNLDDGLQLEEDLRKQLQKKYRILLFIDVFISLTIIGPMVIGFWRGIWNLMDVYLEGYSGWYSFIAGCLVHTIFTILRNSLHDSVASSWKKSRPWRLFWKITQILYTYVFGVACNTHWRGGWIVFDDYFGSNIWFVTAAMLSMLAALIFLRSLRNLVAPPIMICVDNFNYVFWFPTRYKLNTRDWSLYLLDCAFSVGVVGTLVVFVWRGFWILFDIYLFPDDREYSALGSLAIGYVIVTVTFCLQPLMRYVCTRLQGLARLITADGFLLLSFLGTVNVWRGIWNVLDLWLIPENREMSCWITHIGCFVLLVLLNCSNSILVRGVYIDAEEEDGKCVAFPCHYLRLFFKVEREKKEARRRNLLVASKDFRPRTEGNTKDAENGALLPNSTPATILPANPESLV